MSNIYEKPDFYTKKAKDAGYFARSIYKLEEIENKMHLFKKGMRGVDLGCAPGSWSQYVSQVVGDSGLVVGIDYKKILCAANNIVLVHGNFMREDNQSKIAEYGPFNAVISDMAPDTSGDRLTDCYKSSELVREALNFAYRHLKAGGFFIAKIFQGGDEREIANLIKETFESVKWFKPNSCRKNSFETFLIGINYKGQPPKPSNDADIFNDDNYTGEMPW